MQVPGQEAANPLSDPRRRRGPSSGSSTGAEILQLLKQLPVEGGGPPEGLSSGSLDFLINKAQFVRRP